MIYIIAEVGVNHNGSLKEAKRLIKAAKKTGVDAVKFQTFKASSLVVKETKKANYQRTQFNEESQYEMLKKLELTKDDFKELKAYTEDNNLDFLSSAFDMESLDFLISLDLKIYKIPSGEITNKPLLRKIGSLNQPTILSTGMCTLEEIKKSLNTLIESGLNKKNITVLHCNTDYPTNFKDVHLRAMVGMKDLLGVNVGYSDHTIGSEVSVGAVALGATIIEKHFTMDKEMMGPDHSSSLEPKELEHLVTSVRNISTSLGSAEKKPTKSEMKNVFYVRKSIVASKRIKKGENFSEDNLSCMRPAGGISPMRWDDVIGKKASREFLPQEFIET
jgi:N,N'-diacetyllegionaminate synthase